MKQQFFNAFLKGIDERVSETSGDEVRFRQLQNVRLHKRGSTGSITRMSGYQRIASQYDQSETFLGAEFYNDYLIILFTRSGSTYLNIFDVSPLDTDIEATVPQVGLTASPTTYDILVASSAPTYAELTLLDNTIFITALEKQLNFISGSIYLNDFISTTPTVTVATSATSGTLEQNEDYWYKVRYRYYDGHKTATSNPVHVNTDSNTSIQLTITALEEDLDGGWIDIEIFRRKGTQDYFRIDRITPNSSGYTVSGGTFTYEDTGEPNLEALTGQSYVWASTSETQEIVRDRLVKANNTYLSSQNNSVLTINKNETTVNTTEQGLPLNTEVEVFTQVRKEDGTKSLFTSQGSIETDSDDARLQSRLSTPYSSEDDIKEIATYARFIPKPATDTIAFNSLEIYNQNVPSIATAGTGSEDKPTNPHIWLGWKYLRADNNTTPTYPQIYDEEWDNGTDTPSDNTDNYFPVGSSTGTLSVTSISVNSAVLDLDIYDGNNTTNIGQSLPYSKFAYHEGTVSDDSVIYRLAFYDALREAIRQGKCKVRLTALNNVDFLSNERPDDDFINYEANVIALKDTSIDEDQIVYEAAPDEIFPTNKNHLYLVLESGTPFDDFTNQSANNDGVLGDYDAVDVPDLTHRYKFELIGLERLDTTDYTTTSANTWDEDIDYDYRLKLTDYTNFSNDAGVLLKTQTTNTTEGSLTTPDIQGWEKTVNNKFEFYSINDWNEYVTIVTEEDILQQFDEDFPNQLIWSGSYLRNSASNAIRNFDYTNVKYISGRFGNIIKISYILGKLIVFCERGVNVINVGEVLTRQTSGQTFVDSSSLLNDDYWVLENLQDVKAKSVVKHENKLFFCDGYDVWMYNGEFKNLTDGRITLDNTKDYIGSYDPRNKEYHLSDDEGTFTYSLELGEWTGKHTFSMLIAEHRKNNFYGVVSYTDANSVTEIVPAVMNTGNDFDGRSFSSIIDSVAQYTQMPTGIKKFRKFYTDLGLFTGANSFDESYDIASYDGEENTRLEYGNDGNTYTSVNLGTKKVANGFVHVGIDGSRSTGYYLYWKLITSDPNLQLNSIGLLYMLKNRL